MIREDPSLIDDFRSGLELALEAYDNDPQEANDPAAELTEAAIEAMNEEVRVRGRAGECVDGYGYGYGCGRGCGRGC